MSSTRALFTHQASFVSSSIALWAFCEWNMRVGDVIQSVQAENKKNSLPGRGSVGERNRSNIQRFISIKALRQEKQAGCWSVYCRSDVPECCSLLPNNMINSIKTLPDTSSQYNTAGLWVRSSHVICCITLHMYLLILRTLNTNCVMPGGKTTECRYYK